MKDITIQKEKIDKDKGVVVLPIEEYNKLRRRADIVCLENKEKLEKSIKDSKN